MSRLTAAVLAAIAVSAAGCGVARDTYDRDVNALRETNEQLEARVRELQPIAEAYDRLSREYKISEAESQFYDSIAKQLADALAGLRGADGTDMSFDPKKGVWTFGTDLLFDSGSFTVGPKGMEILRKFADAYRGQNMRFRIVGHTDNAPIVRANTKSRLDTDTNMELSSNRAMAVYAQLLKFNLPESRFAEIVGMGNSSPAAPNDKNSVNRKKNRRVEIFLVKTGAQNSSANR